MQERFRHELATVTAEVMLVVLEDEYKQGVTDVDSFMRRLKDLSAYSLSHAEILNHREGVELLALGMFFGMTSQPGFHKNQTRLSYLSPETISYQGQAEVIEQQIAARKAVKHLPPSEEDPDKPQQMRLL